MDNWNSLRCFLGHSDKQLRGIVAMPVLGEYGDEIDVDRHHVFQPFQKWEPLEKTMVVGQA